MAESDITRRAEKTPGYAWVILIVTYLVSFAAPMGQFKLPSIFSMFLPELLQGNMAMAQTTAGFLMTSISIVGIILAFPGAFICRKIGLRWTVTIATLGVIVGGLVPVLVGPDLMVLQVCRIIEGLGIALVGVAAPTIISLWFPDKTRGLALGFWCTWVPASITLDYNIDPALYASFGWQGVFMSVVIFSVVALILFNIFYKVPHGEFADYNVEGSFGECMKLLKNKYIWLLGFCFLIFLAGQTGIVNTYLPTFLETPAIPGDPMGGWGWTAAAAGTATSVVTAIGFVSNPLGGFICDRLPVNQKRWVVIGTAILYLFCFFFMFQSANVGILWAGIIIMGICAGLGGGGLRTLAPTIMHQSAMAATMGMAVLQFMQCIGNCFSPVFGALIDGGIGWFDACLYTIFPMSIVMLILAWFIRPDQSARKNK